MSQSEEGSGPGTGAVGGGGSGPGPGSEELDQFRQQWLQELQFQVKLETAEHGPDNSANDRQNLARSLYQIGINEERAGNPFKAVNFYAKACRIFPDIEKEFNVYHDSPDRSLGSSHTQTPAFVSDGEDNDNRDEENEDPTQGATQGSSSQNVIEASLRPNTNRIAWLCEKETPTTNTHISCLPYDVMLRVFEFVVFPQFDFRSLEQCALVCRGFYFFAREPCLWKEACLQVWGDKIPTIYSELSWRQMYLKRPRLNFHGIYISKIHYIRQGERAFDATYNIFLTVEYFRYLRFFPDGTVLMYTSPEDPKLIVPKLKYPNVRLSGIKTGHFKLKGDKVKIFLEDSKFMDASESIYRKSRKAAQGPIFQNSFYITLSIASLGRKPSCKLTWMNYSVQNMTLSTSAQNPGNPGQMTEFNINSSQFKPFLFSRVKTYTVNH